MWSLVCDMCSWTGVGGMGQVWAWVQSSVYGTDVCEWDGTDVGGMVRQVWAWFQSSVDGTDVCEWDGTGMAGWVSRVGEVSEDCLFCREGDHYCQNLPLHPLPFAYSSTQL
ncbi:hypothetical protein Pmani_035179 [Petrolisthes manimaculis]|uniref:Uncharacterized protein n=1 Tax=Petrolisthes manimaculis TaxID=1843537 RepID=A0AAE1NMV3_9EUCA|nr:hypothetical protein Pmani_035179 [Petrolisthes manimaculis]